MAATTLFVNPGDGWRMSLDTWMQITAGGGENGARGRTCFEAVIGWGRFLSHWSMDIGFNAYVRKHTG